MKGEPTHLASLIRWYRDVVAEAVPARIHSRAMSEGGTPEWHATFRAWLIDAAGRAVDQDGSVRCPFRFWLWTMRADGRSGRVRADFLARLAFLEYDWLAAVRTITPLTEDGEVIAQVYATAALQHFWRLMQCTPRRDARPPKSEAQHTAEEGM